MRRLVFGFLEVQVVSYFLGSFPFNIVQRDAKIEFSPSFLLDFEGRSFDHFITSMILLSPEIKSHHLEWVSQKLGGVCR